MLAHSPTHKPDTATAAMCGSQLLQMCWQNSHATETLFPDTHHAQHMRCTPKTTCVAYTETTYVRSSTDTFPTAAVPHQESAPTFSHNSLLSTAEGRLCKHSLANTMVCATAQTQGPDSSFAAPRKGTNLRPQVMVLHRCTDALANAAVGADTFLTAATAQTPYNSLATLGIRHQPAATVHCNAQPNRHPCKQCPCNHQGVCNSADTLETHQASILKHAHA